MPRQRHGKTPARWLSFVRKVVYSCGMADSDNQRPRKKNGTGAVIFILTLCGLGAAFTALNYTAQAISTAEAKLLFDGKALATVPTSEAHKIKKGMPATVTIDGYAEKKFSAVVDFVSPDPDSAEETLVMLNVISPPTDAKPPVACQVTVDTSVPPELVKAP